MDGQAISAGQLIQELGGPPAAHLRLAETGQRSEPSPWRWEFIAPSQAVLLFHAPGVYVTAEDIHEAYRQTVRAFLSSDDPALAGWRNLAARRVDYQQQAAAARRDAAQADRDAQAAMRRDEDASKAEQRNERQTAEAARLQRRADALAIPIRDARHKARMALIEKVNAAKIRMSLEAREQFERAHNAITQSGLTRERIEQMFRARQMLGFVGTAAERGGVEVVAVDQYMQLPDDPPPA